ncbi:hypothetical protein [Clostridium vincentii]|uniref:Uncharacterized protein n=1 Tax=Clostridium vincentii TaxID=52704 RepID=A0A2T0BGW7_9CLOT|nr:hypothetical protein [Clostridium vincentii]PRR83129.1 hypothetical protein CLVI_11650 [Clostridium vincentii]
MDRYIIPVLLLIVISFSLFFIYNSFNLRSNDRLKRYVGRSFFDLIGIIPVMALFSGVMVLLLKGISILMNFTMDFQNYYIILITSIFIYIISRIIGNIVTYITSIVLANKYLNEGLDKEMMKKIIRRKKGKIKMTKVFIIFIVVLICYLFVRNTLELNYNIVILIICATINTLAYTIIFKLEN